MDHIFCYYSYFVYLAQLNHISKKNFIIMIAFDTDNLYHHNLDCCGHDYELFDFCYKYYNYVREGNLPKFGISNKIPQLCCQHYPSQLDGLTTAEEAVIVKAHPVITILKLRPNNKFNPKLYQGIKRHSVLLPQNPDLFLILLPSETTYIHDILRIIWAGKLSL